VEVVDEEVIMTGDRVVDSILDKIILSIEPKTGRTCVRNRTEGRRGGTMNPTSISIGMSGLEESGVAVQVPTLPLSLVLLLLTRKHPPPAGSVGVARADRTVEVEALRRRRRLLLRRRAPSAAAVAAVVKIAGQEGGAVAGDREEAEVEADLPGVGVDDAEDVELAPFQAVPALAVAVVVLRRLHRRHQGLDHVETSVAAQLLIAGVGLAFRKRSKLHILLMMKIAARKRRSSRLTSVHLHLHRRRLLLPHRLPTMKRICERQRISSAPSRVALEPLMRKLLMMTLGRCLCPKPMVMQPELLSLPLRHMEGRFCRVRVRPLLSMCNRICEFLVVAKLVTLKMKFKLMNILDM